jgi:hypothetical protein
MQKYCGPVTNLGYTGYDGHMTYWTVLDHIKQLTKEDEVYIMWPGLTTLSVWYDDEWIAKNDCRGFFPNAEGNLWFTRDIPFQGFYKQHPDFSASFTQLVVQTLQCMLNAQMLLESVGCKYTMLFNINPWVDIRPVYGEKYTTIWDTILNITDDSVLIAKNILKMSPVRQLFDMIKWENCIGVPDDREDLKNYRGLWEYDVSNKEYFSLKNGNDMHPSTLAHHDYLLEKILHQDPYAGAYRNRAIEIAEQCSNMTMPKFETKDNIATPNMPLLCVSI